MDLRYDVDRAGEQVKVDSLAPAPSTYIPSNW